MVAEHCHQFCLHGYIVLRAGGGFYHSVSTVTGHMFRGHEGDEMLHCLNGFLIFVCRYGNIYYVSPQVEDILGMKMVRNSVTY